MKRFWLVLLSLGLIVAFSATAMAVDVKFSGEYYAAGMYLDKVNVSKSAAANPSTAFYYQRLRLNTTFIVHPGLFLNTRADIMERAWGANRTIPAGGTGSTDMNSSGTIAENENIAFDIANLMYISPIGIFIVGYQDDGAWGTVFGNTTLPLAKITYIFMQGPIRAGAYLGKFSEQNNTWKNPGVTTTDRDVDMYVAFVQYTGKTIEGGLLFKHYRFAAVRPTLNLMQQFTAAVPYVKAKFGPVAVEAEFTYLFGDYVKNEGGPGALGGNQKFENAISAYVDVAADFGVAYAGLTGAYMAGNDPGTADKMEGGVGGGFDWNPTLIMFNNERYYWGGNINGNGTTRNPNPRDNALLGSNDGQMTNAWFIAGRVGARPVDKLDVKLSVAYATADKKPAGVLNNPYGTEIDVTATYKITNNLSYMIGAGYWFVGDFYKGTSASNEVQNDYIVLNKLTLTF